MGDESMTGSLTHRHRPRRVSIDTDGDVPAPDPEESCHAASSRHVGKPLNGMTPALEELQEQNAKLIEVVKRKSRQVQSRLKDGGTPHARLIPKARPIA